MKVKSLFAVLIAALALTACNNKDNEPGFIPDTETKSVFLKFNTGSLARAVEETAVGEQALLASALIYFIDDSTDPVVYATRTVGATGADATLTEIIEGVQFTGIPHSTENVYVIGNYNSADPAGNHATFPTTPGTRLSVVKEVMLNIQQIVSPTLGGIDQGQLLTVMDGMAPVNEYSASTSGQWNSTVNTPADGDLFASVTIQPINARIEINQIEYDGAGALASYTIEGIYINYFYSIMPLNLDLSNSGNVFVDNGSDVNKYNIANMSTNFGYMYYTTMYDTVEESETVPTPAAPVITAPAGTDNVWAYHVFGNHNPVPHIIVKLTGVSLTDGTDLGDRYLTVTGYNTTGGTPVTTFERGTLYQIASLTFSEDDLELVPEPDEISLWVEVNVQDWTTVPVIPVL